MDVTIKFHRTQWHNLPENVKVYIGQMCGPLYPNTQDVLTMTIDESVWARIQRMMQPAAKE